MKDWERLYRKQRKQYMEDVLKLAQMISYIAMGEDAEMSEVEEIISEFGYEFSEDGFVQPYSEE